MKCCITTADLDPAAPGFAKGRQMALTKQQQFKLDKEVVVR